MWSPKDFNIKFYPKKPYQPNSTYLSSKNFVLKCLVILSLRLPKNRVQKLKRAYTGWEKGSGIVFGHQLMLLYKYIKVMTILQ